MISKESLRRYIYYSTILGVFSSVLAVQVPFSIRLFDAIMLLNLLLMPLLINCAMVPAWILCFIIYLGLSGCIGILSGTDNLPLFAKEFLGISVSLLYFYYFFRLIHNDQERAFLAYARMAYWFTIIGFPFWVGKCIASHGYERYYGLAREPAAFCELVLPAYYWCTYLSFNSRRHLREVAVLTLAIVLSGSSLGYISVAFGLVLLLSGRKKHMLAVPIVVFVLLSLTYTISPFFRLRVDDTLLAATSGDVGSSNLSTYALISNMLVTQQVLRESPLIGNGLGSHALSHARLIDTVPGSEQFVERGISTLNAPDAASLTLRVLSELGILGFLGLLAFVFRYHVGGRGGRAAISNAILVSFFLKLIRGGLYFPPEQFFFIFVYILNHRRSKSEVRGAARRAPLKLPLARLNLEAG
jgi:hypothetical protein